MVNLIQKLSLRRILAKALTEERHAADVDLGVGRAHFVLAPTSDPSPVWFSS